MEGRKLGQGRRTGGKEGTLPCTSQDSCVLNVSDRDAEVTAKAGGGWESKDPTQELQSFQRKEVAAVSRLL